MYTYLEKCLINIEVTDSQGKDQVIYFPKYPVFNSLTGNLRDFVMQEVERSSHRDKIVSLLGYTDGVKEKIEYSYNLKKKKNITESNMKDSFFIATRLSVVICVYILLYYQVNIEYQQAQYYSDYVHSTIRLGMSLVQLVFSFLYVFYWYQLKLWYNP